MGCAHGFKFSDEITHYVYDLSLDNVADDWIGDVSTCGYIRILFLGSFGEAAEPLLPVVDAMPQAYLTEQEVAVLAGAAGAILTEDDQGFVDAWLTDSSDELMSTWDMHQDDYQDSLGPDEDAITSTDGLHWYYQGRQVLTIMPDDDRNAKLRSMLEREDWGEDVWLISDHGNATRLNIWEN